jgi:predicted Zn-dependent protease
LRPLYQSAVADIHARKFAAAEALCEQGLDIKPGDHAFLDLQSQIPQWREDNRQARITDKYNEAVNLVHSGDLTAATEACREGLQMDPGNSSFDQLLRHIAHTRHDQLEAKLVTCYKESSMLMAHGEYADAERRCREGLRLSPNDTVLNSLLTKILDHERV